MAENPVERVKSRMASLWQEAHLPVDIASLAFLRIAFGAVMLGECFSYFSEGFIEHYVEAEFMFRYWGFEWVPRPPGNSVYLLWGVVAASATGIMLGYYYRASAIIFFLSFSWFFLLEATEYLNHFYFVILLAFLMIFLPADRLWSMDSVRRPQIRSDHVPAWALWLAQFQIAVVYIGGGVAKLNPDWLRGEPMKHWIGWESDDVPIIGKHFEHEWAGWISSYGGLMLDLFIVPLLMWRTSRPFAYIAVVWFHLMNHTMFNIGIFPWLMMLGTTIFFEPGWPRAMFARFGAVAVPGKAPKKYTPDMSRKGKAVAAVLLLFVGAQVTMPFRHFAYEGDPSWTEEGHQWSWHMKLRHKNVDVEFYVVEPGQERYEWDLDEELTSRQERRMSSRPDLILFYAHHIRDTLEEMNGGPVEVYVNATASLNFRPEQTFIDPSVNLAAEPRSLAPKHWVWPLAFTLDGEPIEGVDPGPLTE